MKPPFCRKRFGFRSLKPQMYYAMFVVWTAYESRGLRCVFTSGDEPGTKHSDQSLHYAGCAVDADTADPHSDEQMVAIQNDIRAALPGRDWDVLIEDLGGPNEHHHVEWQPKRMGVCVGKDKYA